MPLIPEPSGRPAILGISHPECLVAVGSDFCLESNNRDRFDPVQEPSAGWPKFYFLEKVKEVDPFAIKTLFHLDTVYGLLSCSLVTG